MPCALFPQASFRICKGFPSFGILYDPLFKISP